VRRVRKRTRWSIVACAGVVLCVVLALLAQRQWWRASVVMLKARGGLAEAYSR